MERESLLVVVETDVVVDCREGAAVLKVGRGVGGALVAEEEGATG